MSDIRRRFTSRLPTPWVKPARRLARLFDQCTGFPLAHRRPGSVAMFHVGRCGSTVLGNLLSQHPKIFWDGELYYGRRTFRNSGSGLFTSEGFLRRQMWVSGSRYYGFEIKFLPDQHMLSINMPLSEYIAQLKRVGVTHYVVLERKNYLRRMISQYVGSKTGRRHIEDESEAKLETVRLDLASSGFGTLKNRMPLLECLAEIDRAYRTLEDLLMGENALQLEYESDVLESGPQIGYEKLCGFLGVDPTPVEVKNRRTNPFAIREIVENFDELANALEGTPYQWMLTD